MEDLKQLMHISTINFQLYCAYIVKRKDLHKLSNLVSNGRIFFSGEIESQDGILT